MLIAPRAELVEWPGSVRSRLRDCWCRRRVGSDPQRSAQLRISAQLWLEHEKCESNAQLLIHSSKCTTDGRPMASLSVGGTRLIGQV